MNLIEIKETLDEKKAERERLIGKQSSYLDQLKELGFKTIGTAEKALQKIETDLDKMEREHQQQVSTFEDNYGELLS